MTNPEPSLEPTEQETHPVAKSRNPKKVARGLMVLITATLIAGALSALYWLI
jgi:hypothetical protein